MINCRERPPWHPRSILGEIEDSQRIRALLDYQGRQIMRKLRAMPFVPGDAIMEREALQEWLKRKPFQPFRVFVSDGRIYDVRYPRTYLLAYTYIKIGVPAPDLPPGVSDHGEYVALKDITRVEPLPASLIGN